MSIHKRYCKAEINEPYDIQNLWIRANELLILLRYTNICKVSIMSCCQTALQDRA